MRCLAKTKGTPVTSSKSATLLGLMVAAAGHLPPRPAGAVGVGPTIARGAGAGAPVPPVPDIVTCGTLSKK